MHLGYHELRKLLSEFAEERMAARNQNQNQGQGQNYNQQPYGGGARSNAPPSAPSGPSSKMPPPQTPIHSKIPPADELPVVGHGDKIKREAGELVEDVTVQVEREERRSRRDEDKYERWVFFLFRLAFLCLRLPGNEDHANG
jgi:RNA-binding protein Luc7-like 2